MKIPFYTSFKEFKDNYETDLEKWLSIYPDGDEMDYLKLVEDYYKESLKSKFIYFKDEDYWIARDKERTGEGVTIDDLLDILYNEYSGNDFAEYMKEKINSTDKTYKTYLEEVYIEPFKPFIDNNDFLGLYFNDTKFKNFQYAKGKIYKFISDRRKEINGVQTTDEVTSTAEEQHKTGEEHEKITINGSIQLIGYIFTELIEKGYIEPKRKSGKTNASATAEMLLNHFNFTYNANGEQPSKEYLKKALFEQNQLSPDKATFIKIPHLKKLID
ncbi:hypothetical protein [Riemerella anatipestifer]|uniref:hypothetical protein n=1 Tax=Riemerella anatipestifer TaxID=34085 RepID=UPI0002AB490E|nr:hypothetical protein [Riemerella anatipestifer]AGC40764.1 hypothetical protein G148_1460 [Riemerella anatipestifer RA-CH-2]MBT0563059.1 hypothetical protein [Riemerella anatipestifer]MDY3503121.1 hypothetical protein [Riemerella anatipestifer]OBP44936.1 hypothetical protein AWR42_03035 [Riemerella anatipestifer]OBP48194.1 hypothetical protein AWM67_00670 [Riemerella anatipestifer]